MCVEADRLPSQEERSTQGGPRGFKPLAVFAVIAVLLAGGLTIFFALAKPNDPPSSNSKTSTLTAQEASRQLRRLIALDARAARTGDLSLLGSVVTSDGPLRSKAVKSLEKLKRDGVSDQSRIKWVMTRVDSRSTDTIKISGTRIVYPCYRANGEDVTHGPVAMRQEGLWILRNQNGSWLLDSAKLVSQRALNVDAHYCS